MMGEARAWLPSSALTAEAASRALSAVAADWSKDWFASQPARTAPGGGKRGLGPGSPEQIEVSGKRVTVSLGGRAQRNLLEAALGLRLDGLRPTEIDHALLRRFVLGMVEDLVQRLDGLLASDAPAAGERIGLEMANDAGRLCELSCSATALVPLIKARMSRSTTSSSPLTDRHAALASTRLCLDALLGRAEIGVEDLEGLARGDVILLDRPLDHPIELRMDGSGDVVGRGALGRQDGRFTVRL